MLAGLCPSIGILGVKAEEAEPIITRGISDEIAQLVAALKTEYSTFAIPKTKAKWVNSSTINNLDGTYFMFIMAKNGHHVMINYGAGTSSRYDRLSENCYGSAPASLCSYYPSIWVTVGDWGTGNDTFNYINEFSPDNLLDYAVEIKKYTGSIKYNETKAYKEDTIVQTPYCTGTGWTEYNMWEFYRINDACAGYDHFGEYFGINAPASKSDPAYSIKSLHPSKAKNPYIGTSTDYGWVSYLTAAEPFFFVQNSSGKTFKTYKITHDDINSYWLGVDSYYSDVPINAHTLSQIIREDKNQNITKWPGNYDNQHATDWELIQVSPYTLELYKALYSAKSYVLGGNSNGLYPEDTYLGFLKDVQAAMRDYKANYLTYSESKDYTRNYLDAEAKDLQSYMALLEIEKNPDSYMDIPVEILDFRADGLMFESLNNGATAYALSSGGVSFDGAPAPGSAGTGDNGQAYKAGLIEPYLKIGQILYKEETIRYIATALNKQHHTFADTSISDFNSSKFDSNWNNVFMNMVSGSTAYPLGTWEQTLEKIGGENGGVLKFFEVATCYDLAYYMLTNIWRSTDSTDYVDTGRQLPYNTKVTELNTLRLLKDSNGKYYFRSEVKNGRNLDSGLIYNYPGTSEAQDGRPNLNAISDLGFEKQLGIGTTGTAYQADSMYGRNNYHVMYHVESAFVYYESKNFSFTFSGDDDVYFFINGQRVRDLGGLHPEASCTFALNGEVAKTLALEDGTVCTFDMFLVDRHTDGINLNLETNIEMTPVNVVSEKIQYKYSTPGTVGDEIREGSVVADGAEVGYGFKLLNRGEMGVTDVSFRDDALNVELSPTIVSLNGRANASELLFVYRKYDSATELLSSADPISIDCGSMISLLERIFTNPGSTSILEADAYILTGLTEDQIMILLSLGLPADVQLSVYGFHRTVSGSVGSYTNKVVATCSPMIRQNDGTFTYGDAVKTFATRTLTVRNLDTVTAQPMDVVLDYGKPIEFTVQEILKTLQYEPEDATVSFMGLRSTDVHGTTTTYAPAWLNLSQNGEEMETAGGLYERYYDTFAFTPTGMLEAVDRVYAVIRVNDNRLGGTWYLSVELRMIPANIMYYEAESLPTTDLTTETKTTVNETVTKENTFVQVGSQVDGEAAPEVFSYTGKENMLYIGFDNTAEDILRYNTTAAYGGKNFDLRDNWTMVNYGKSMSIGSGALTYSTQNPNGTWSEAVLGQNSAFPLKYTPSADDWVEVRMKIDSLSAANGAYITFRPEFLCNSQNSYIRTRPVINVDASNVGKGYFVLRAPLSSTEGFPDTFRYVDINMVTRINLTFEQITTNSVFTVSFDYFYVGPEETSPSKMQAELHAGSKENVQDPGTYVALPEDPNYNAPTKDAYSPNFDPKVLYFNFDNGNAERQKYQRNPNYGPGDGSANTVNFDLAANWRYNNTRSSGATMTTDGTMVYTVTATGEPWVEARRNGTAGTEDGSTMCMNYAGANAEVAEIRM
ncbi:MAG: fibro-slime domain-containing protein, partial [Oscillospiraceae bacterium]|nr:fibro-slime domain-containing protein [Oscillospiraceae bacterium]